MLFRAAERRSYESVLAYLRDQSTAFFLSFFLSTSFNFQLLPPSNTMSNVIDWDSKTVIGQKAKAAKVTKNSADLNGTSDN